MEMDWVHPRAEEIWSFLAECSRSDLWYTLLSRASDAAQRTFENLRASTSVPQIFQVWQQESKGLEQGAYRMSGE